MPRIMDGPNINSEIPQKKKAIRVIYLRSIFAQSMPTRGEATA
jgi:hypothetical protein